MFDGEGREHDHARLLHLALSLLVIIFDAGDAGARGIGQHAGDVTKGPNLGAALARFAEPGRLRIGERPGRAAGGAPAVIDAGVAALVGLAVDADGAADHVEALRLEAGQPHLAVAEGFQRRHRIGLARRAPALLRLGVAGDADLAGDLVIIRREVGIGDRPVERAAVVALDREVVGQQARKVRGVVQRGAAGAPAVVAGAADRVLALVEDGRSRALEPPAPDVGRDEVGELPVRPLLEQHDLLAGPREHGGEHRTGGAGADDHGIDFFERHLTTSAREGCGAGTARQRARSLRRFHRRRRRHRCADSHKRAAAAGRPSS